MWANCDGDGGSWALARRTRSEKASRERLSRRSSMSRLAARSDPTRGTPHTPTPKPGYFLDYEKKKKTFNRDENFSRFVVPALREEAAFCWPCRLGTDGAGFWPPPPPLEPPPPAGRPTCISVSLDTYRRAFCEWTASWKHAAPDGSQWLVAGQSGGQADANSVTEKATRSKGAGGMSKVWDKKFIGIGKSMVYLCFQVFGMAPTYRYVQV